MRSLLFTITIILFSLSANAQTFTICDTQCNATPIGDCASGHTDTDNIEWPCDIDLDLPNVAANELGPDGLLANGVDSIDASPIIVNFPNSNNTIARTFEDIVVNTPGGGYKILRTWTYLDWMTANIYSYDQIIKNITGNNAACNLVCNSNVNVSVGINGSATLDVTVFLEGNYSFCNTPSYEIEIKDANDLLIHSGTGDITVTELGTFTYVVTDPATMNACWGMVHIEDHNPPCNDPFEICDTECRSEPIGDCASGHTDTDNIEWPCDVEVFMNDTPADWMDPEILKTVFQIDAMDSEPTIVNYTCDLVAMAYDDVVFQLGGGDYKIERTWTVIDWRTGNIFTYVQIIKSNFGTTGSGCTMVCNTYINASVDANGVATLDYDAFLEGNYSNCNPTSFEIEVRNNNNELIASGIGSVIIDQLGVFNYSVTQPSSGNSCWGQINVEDKTTGNDCPPTMTCLAGMIVEIPTGMPDLQLWTNDFLLGDYTNCDLDTYTIELSENGTVVASGTGSFIFSDIGSFTYTVTDPVTGNSCWGNLTVEDEFSPSSSVKEINELTKVNVYPNPVQDVLNFDFTKVEKRGDVIIAILDQTGRKLLQVQNDNQLNVSGLNGGFYIYEIKMNNQTRYGKVSILK